MGDVLQLGDLRELVEEGPDHQPAIDVQQDHHRPEEAHEPVVGEVEVVHQRAEHQREQPPERVEEHDEQPRPDLLLSLLRDKAMDVRRTGADQTDGGFR